MPTYGLTPTGFVPKTFEIIVDEIETAWRQRFGASIDTSESTPDGQIIRLIAEREAALWELGEVLYSAWDPDKAIDAALDALCLITGTKRRGATKSTAMLTLTGDDTTNVPQGSRAATASTGVLFETTALQTLVALAAWAPSTGYSVGQRRTNGSSPARCYICITSGTSAGSGGPLTTAADITDGTVHWRYLGDGAAAADILAACIETGPTVAVSGDINEIDTAVSGWSGVINLLDATLGQDRTSNQGLRLLREIELAAGGNSPVPAIRARMFKAPIFATSCHVFYNNTELTDADGVPPKSVEVMLEGGDEDDIAVGIFNSVAGGIGYFGNQTTIVEDDEGTEHTIKWSRPTAVPIYVIITIEVDADEVPGDVVDQVKALIVTYGDDDNKNPAGMNVRARRVGSEGIKDIDGVLNFTTCYIGTAPGPASEASIAIALRERATYDTSRITVNVTPVTP